VRFSDVTTREIDDVERYGVHDENDQPEAGDVVLAADVFCRSELRAVLARGVVFVGQRD
jgi:ribosomal protein S17|tara:strand:+ start:267 stop:443 length:177 start_codon:yes stop_codon:yes gene_type:complete